MRRLRAIAPSRQPWLLAGCSGLAALALLDLAGLPVVATLPLPCLLLATVLLVWTGWLLASRFAGGEPVDLIALDAGMLAIAAMALLGTALGTLGLLSFPALMLSTSLVCATSHLLVTGHGVPAPGRISIRDGVRRFTDYRPGWSVLFLAGLVAFALAQVIVGRAFRPPIGDALAYHLPFAVEWLQHGDLRMPAPPAGDPSPPYYPLNSSLWMFWTLAPFESEVLTRFVQAPFLILLGLAVYRLAREIGTRVTTALAAVAIGVTVPEISRGASLAENDLIMAALLVAASASLTRLWHRPTAWRVLMTALPLGLAIGTKIVAAPYTGILALALAAAVFWKWRSRGFTQAATLVLVAVGLVALTGGYSYLRNAIVMDNPLYPSGYELFGREILSGIYVMTSEWRRSHPFYPFDWSGFFFGSRHSFGYTITLWVLPGLIAATVAIFSRLSLANRGIQGQAAFLGAAVPARSRTENQPTSAVSTHRRSIPWPALLLCAWTGISLALFWFVIPYHFTRFLSSTVIWGVVAAAWGFGALAERLPFHWRGEIVPTLSIPIVALNVVNIPLDLSIRGSALYWLAAAAVVAGAVAAFLGAQRLKPSTLRRLVVALPVGAAAALLIGWPLYASTYDDRRLSEWHRQIHGASTVSEAWEWVYRQTEGAPATIAVSGTNEVYPLYGEDLDNQLVTILPTGEIAVYGWGDRYEIFGPPDREAWLAALDRADADYIYMTEDVSLGGWPLERAWIDALPERFVPVFQNDAVTIWSVNHPAP